jgi:uncharacterized protein YfaS (alpha-2-macroglobulin family)
VDPENTLIPKLVRGIQAARKKGGAWNNTQENVWVLLAMEKYYQTYEKEEPAFDVRTWLEEGYLGKLPFHSRSTDTHTASVPMWVLVLKQMRQTATHTLPQLVSGSTSAPTTSGDGGKGKQLEEGAPIGQHPALNLLIEKEGKGRCYYRIAMNYSPASLDLPPLDRGFTLKRTYETVDDDGDVEEIGSLVRIKAGARVRVRLSLTTPTVRHHVALVDWLPAGLEPLNPELKQVDDLGSSSNDRTGIVLELLALGRGYALGLLSGWQGRWFDHQNMRDDRCEIFTSYLAGGLYEYTYLARATTLGEFFAPPPKVEEMYEPETFGRGTAHHVHVI